MYTHEVHQETLMQFILLSSLHDFDHYNLMWWQWILSETYTFNEHLFKTAKYLFHVAVMLCWS